MSRSQITLIAFVILAMSIAFCPSHAQAVLITHGDTTLFYDNFESVTEVSTSVPHDLTVDANPTAATGSWTISESDLGCVQVTNSQSTPDPGAASGSQYLRQDRVGSAGGQFKTNFTEQTSGIIHTEFMMYLDEEGSGAFTAAIILQGGSAQRTWVGYRRSVGELQIKNSSSAFISTGLSPILDKWQRWEIDANLTTQTYDIAIDGVTSASSINIPFKDVGTTIDNLWFLPTGDDVRFYVDDVSAVPEPATIMLLITGLVAILLCRRK